MSRIDKEIVGRVMAGPEYSSFTAADFVLIVTWINARDATCRDTVSCPVSSKMQKQIYLFFYLHHLTSKRS